jgi:hypothetical protein
MKSASARRIAVQIAKGETGANGVTYPADRYQQRHARQGRLVEGLTVSLHDPGRRHCGGYRRTGYQGTQTDDRTKATVAIGCRAAAQGAGGSASRSKPVTAAANLRGDPLDEAVAEEPPERGRERYSRLRRSSGSIEPGGSSGLPQDS